MTRDLRYIAVALAASLSLSATIAASDNPGASATTNGEELASRLPRIEFRGGPFIRHPRIITITFTGDDPQLVARLQTFGNTIARTSWWRAVSNGYCGKSGECIGDGQDGVSVVLDDPLPPRTHAVDVSAILRRHAAAGRFGALDADALLLVYLPSGVQLNDAFVPSYCGDGPRAFHRALRLDDRVIGYAVMPRCGDEAALTGTASHELLEIVTSPDTSRPGFAFTMSAPARGFTGAGTEVVDPCGLITRDMEIVESGFTVRRAWSNRSAAEGRDPCVPASAERAYVALMPERQVVRLINRGDSATLTLQAASDRPIETWRVQAIDVTGSQQRERFVDLDLDRTEVAPGESATLRITLRRPPATRLVVGIESTVDGRSYLWPLEVLTK